MKYSYKLRQLLSLASVFFLSPALRLVPAGTAELAGRAAWLSVPVALPFLIIYMYFIFCFLKRRQGHEGLAELILRSLGKVWGRLALGFLGLWLCSAPGQCGSSPPSPPTLLPCSLF